MGDKYELMEPGEWHDIPVKDFKLACCDCCLVHLINFRITRQGKKHKLEMQVFRAQRETGAKRRPYPKKLKELLKDQSKNE